MESMFVLVGSLIMDVALRVWIGEEKSYLVDNAIDIERLVVKMGCNLFEKRQLVTNIDQCVNNISEKLYSEYFLRGIETERKKEIVKQVAEDIRKLNVTEEQFLRDVMMSKDITPEIMKQSEHIRSLWSEKENGAYNNCVRFAADAIIKFTTSLPTFSNEALMVLYRRNEEIWKKFEKQLEEICALLRSSEGTHIEYKEFQIDYLRKIASVNSKVHLFGSNIGKRGIKHYDLSASYIELCCQEANNEELDSEIEISQVFNYGNIIWIGGEAGGGKTTFLQWLATSAATNNNAIESTKGLIPIILKLREVEFPMNYKREIEKSINFSCPDGWIEYLFKYDKVLLLFDGLDEIPEEHRNEVYEEIERIYDYWQQENSERKRGKERKSRIVVTSRMYVEDELECDHCFFEIMRMKMKNIKKFIKYWHQAILKENVEDQKKINEYSQNVIDNVVKSKSLKAISGTPLLCAMICALGYANDKIIPANKLELYEKCCKMLINERDVERHIKYDDKLDILDYSKKERVLEDIAYYMMNAEKVSMRKEDIVEHLKAFLIDSTLIEDKAIRDNPEILVDYLIRRTGIIREDSIGTVEFVHKTFMEYIASNAIMRKSEWSIIPSKVIHDFWKETIVMCFGHMARDNASIALKELIHSYAQTQNKEYIFMASLCTKGASDIEISVNEKIDGIISRFIPPHKKDISQLSKMGDIIIPFLYNKDNYSEQERNRCLLLLDRLLDETESEEIVPALYSYVEGKGVKTIKDQAINILTTCPSMWLDEHSIREKISDWFVKEFASSEKCIVTENLLSLLLAENVRGKLYQLKDITILYSTSSDESLYGIDSEIYKEFVNVKKIRLENVSYSYQLEVLQSINELETLWIDVYDDSEIILDKLKHYVCVKTVREFTYSSYDLLYICHNDLAVFKQLEMAQLFLKNTNIEMEIHSLTFSKSLKKFHIYMSEDAYLSNGRGIDALIANTEIVEVTTLPDMDD